MKIADKGSRGTILFLCCISTMVIPFIVSCGKSAAVAASSNIQMQVLNLSPDALPVNLWIGYIKQNNSPYTYPFPSGYFSLSKIDTPIQLRSYYASVSTVNLISISTPLKSNLKYTLFLTGSRADSTLTPIFTVDTAAVSTVGRGKIRFVNASYKSNGLDITANGVLAFTNQTYKNVSKFIEIPPGIYDFKVMPTGTTANVLSDLPNVTVNDGKLYTLYSYGIVGRIDSAAFGTGILANK
jgi:hypothetical protein